LKQRVLVWMMWCSCAGALAAEPNLDELQRRLDAAKREQQKSAAASGPKPAAVRQATLVVRSDSPCRLSVDGKPLAELGAGVTRSLSIVAGEALVECQSSTETDAKYTNSYKFDAGTKVVLQIELQDKILAARQRRDAAPASSPVAASRGPAAQPLATAPAAGSRSTPTSPTPAPARVELRAESDLREVGQLTITDRYNKKTVVDVYPLGTSTPRLRRYSSGDRIDENRQVLAVRIGTHIGVVESGALWKFPLKPGTAGSAIVNFDGLEVSGEIRWKVEDRGNGNMGLDAEAVIPINFSASRGQLTGRWKADFDATYPMPVRSEFSARATFSSANESTVTSWSARP
jgi:hypothetical protein